MLAALQCCASHSALPAREAPACSENNRTDALPNKYGRSCNTIDKLQQRIMRALLLNTAVYNALHASNRQPDHPSCAQLLPILARSRHGACGPDYLQQVSCSTSQVQPLQWPCSHSDPAGVHLGRLHACQAQQGAHMPKATPPGSNRRCSSRTHGVGQD